MLRMKDLDDDGFELKFDDEITREEKEYYVRAYPNVNMIADRRVHCTSCDGHIGTAPASEEIIRMHPVLRVTHCNQCNQFYNVGEFEKGEDGSELYCRWCGQGGDVFCCSSCAYVFCKKCILRNFSHSTLQDIKRKQYWDCFACAPESILPLQAQYWALKNFFAKQKLMIERQANAGRCYVEIMNALNHDSSTCCPNLHQTGLSSDSDMEEEVRPCARGKGRRRSVRNRKRRRIEGSSEGSSDDTAEAKENKTKLSDNESDSIELISESCASRVQETALPESATAALPIIIENVRSENAAQQVESPSVDGSTLTHTFLVSVTTTSNEPIYHTINGHRIELNSAAQQNSIRLSDGKIIHVRKLSTISNAAAAAHQAPTMSQPIHIQQECGQQITQFQSHLSANSSQAFQQITASTISYSTQSTESWHGPRTYTNGPVGDACTQFERRIFDGHEVCQNTDHKLKTLMNSNAYKTVRNVNDVKELLIHMSYLLTFTLGRYQTLQDKCIDDLRQLGFQNEADSLSNGKVINKYGSDSDVNEVEIVEPKHATINLDDSDDEQPKKVSDRSDATQLTADIVATTSRSQTSIADTGQKLVESGSTAKDTRRESDVVVIVLRQDILHDQVHDSLQPPNGAGIVLVDPKFESKAPVEDGKSDECIS